MSAGELLRIGLEEGDCDGGAFGDDREEVAAGEGEEEGVGLADRGVAARLFVEQRFIAKVVARVQFAERFSLLIENLDGARDDQIDPVGYLPGVKTFSSLS